MPTTTHPTYIGRYADTLERIVREEMSWDPERYENVRTWTDLHDVCDANEFLQITDDALGMVVEDFVDPHYIHLTTTAIAMVEARLWGTTA